MLKTFENISFIGHAGMATDAFYNDSFSGMVPGMISMYMYLISRGEKLKSENLLCKPNTVLNLFRDDIFPY